MNLELTFLGTASAIPSKKRNHTSILLSLKDEKILIDCGEGTQRQLKIAKIKSSKITRIFLTHWHADHSLGLAGLFQTLGMADYSKTLKLYGPTGTKKKIGLLEKIYGKFKIKIEIKEIGNKKIEENEFIIESKKMQHLKECNAYSIKVKDKLRIHKSKLRKLKIGNNPELKKIIQGKNIKIGKKIIKSKDLTFLEKGKKISFILDTKNNVNTVKIAKDSDVLVCESSFLPEEKEQARNYKHLTWEDATLIAKKANVKNLYLTHISQKHENKTNLILKNAKKIFSKTKIAKDFDSVKI
ncbi:ribonuclease Z [Candidatus Parvarchaeota archaeon]|nr:MAG: ribonuclease Z [Candidatus Parvarchaeota archaeon]